MNLGSSSLESFGNEIVAMAENDGGLMLVGHGRRSGPNGIGYAEASLTFRFTDLSLAKRDFETIFSNRQFPEGTRLVETIKNEDLSFTHNELIVVEG